jgi:glycerol kinase
MKEETGVELKTIKVDGGATANNYLMQFQSDILNATIKVPHILETTALGVCYLAGLKTGYFGSTTEIRKIHQYDRQFKPKMSEVDRVRKYKNWKRAVAATRQFI